MSVPFPVDKNVMQLAKHFGSPLQTATIELVRQVRKDPALKERYVKISEGHTVLKKFNPILCPNGFSRTGARKNEDMVPTGFLFLDFDQKDNGHSVLWEKVKDHLDEWQIYLVEKSARGGGHMIVKRNPNLTIEEDIADWGKRLELEFDPIHDLARAMFVVPEEYVYYENPALYDLATTEVYSSGKRPEAAPQQPAKPQRQRKQLDPATLNYLGIPYNEIIDCWWRLFNGGKTPVEGDRNTKIFELAVNLRHICGFDLDVLDAVIPNYDNFPEEEKLAVIENALRKEQTRMPLRLQQVLNAIKAEHADNAELVAALDDAEEQDEQFYINRIPDAALPMGVRDSMQSLPRSMAMPAIVGVAPMIGALATGVKLDVHGDMKHLNLTSYIIGEAGSNKSKMDALYALWMHHLQELEALEHAKENAFLEQKELKKNAKEQPKDPKVCLRLQSLRTSLSQIVTRLNNAQGKHLYSFTPEVDMLAQSNNTNWSNTSVVQRCSYDNSSFSTDYKDGKSTGLFVPEVKWNMTLCGTPDALFRCVKNYTDGEVTRIMVARTPDNTFAPLVQLLPRKEENNENIRKVARLLEEMQGEVALPLLEGRCQQWLEEVRLSTLKNDDKVRARLRMRSAVSAMRVTCCCMLCAYAEKLIKEQQDPVKYLQEHPYMLNEEMQAFQTDAFMTFFDVMADYIIDTLYFYFAARIEKAREAQNYVIGERVHCGFNDTIFAKLAQEFTIEDARVAKGDSATVNSVRMMLKNWRKQGLIANTERGKYKKLA